MENKFLGVPVIGVERWTGLGWSVFTMVFCYLLPTILILVITGNFQNPDKKPSIQLTLGILVVCVLFFHLFKWITNKWVKTSYYSKLGVIIQIIITFIAYFVIRQS